MGLTAVAETPFYSDAAVAALVGGEPAEATYRSAGLAAAAESRPAEDGHGPVAYKRAMTEEMTVRALRSAVERAQAQR